MSFKDQVNKKVGKNVIARGDQILQLPRIPTGSLSLDAETGGGVPIGRITSFVGDWSSGKTAVTLKIAANFQRIWPYKEIYWIDAEGVWDPKWAKVLGLDPVKVNVVRPEYGEQAYNIALGAYDDGAGLIVIDSIASLASKAEMEADMDDILVAPMARVNSKFMKKIGVAFTEKDDIPPTLIYLNQLREKIGSYGNPEIEPGGRALSFYPSLKVTLRKGELYDGKKIYKSVTANDEGVEVKAQVIKFYTDKNKTAPFKRRGHFWFYFDRLDSLRPKGCYDRLEEVIRYAKKYEIVQNKGDSKSIFVLINPKTAEIKQFKGNAALAEYIRSDSNVQEWIETEVMTCVLEDMAGTREPKEAEVKDIQEKQVGGLKLIRDDKEEGDESSEGTEGAETA